VTEVVFTSSRVQIAGRKTLAKLEDHSTTGILNTFSLLNIEIQIRYLQNTYMILDIHLALWNVLWILYILSRKEILRIPWRRSISILRRKEVIKSTKNLQQGPINSTMSKYNIIPKDDNLDYGARVPIHSLPQSHPNSPQVNIVPPPAFKHNMPTCHNTTTLAEHTTYKYYFGN
jgi:hypothetical protein